mmetsp:Transcript_25458/g.37542  ORF Transcript_25458/g.37542 Transcript_25458/m.37542 type:complete len:335 (-) Transcript_25458:105-1109(-)
MIPLSLRLRLGIRSVVAPVRSFSDHIRPGNRSHIHFRATPKPHPLGAKKIASNYETDAYVQGDHTGRLQNHIWTKDELQKAMTTLYRHNPQTISDHVMNKLMYGMYHSFNFITGYQHKNPSVRSIEWRLIILESVAGVPGFVAAGFRHFRSLRTLERDHGWISTLLEEAENERMHLLVCLHMFEASYLTRALVVAAQLCLTPLLMGVYLVKPSAMHRFVGYLEETACHTYVSIIEQAQVPGTHLNDAWKDLPAPDIAKGYWKLQPDAKFLDVLMCMCADETHHRDVNHTFADMKSDDPNPFVEKHKEDAVRAWRLHEEHLHREKFVADETNVKV